MAVAAAMLALAPLPALAQSVPPSVAPPSRTELAPPVARAEERSGVTLTVDGDMARTPCALDAPEMAGIHVTLTQVSFTGAEGAADVDLAPAYAAYLGRELPISVLCDIRAQATTLLTNAGYLAAVEIPEQRLAGGAAQLRVVLGRLTALRVRGDAGPSERLLASYLQHMVGQPVFNTHEAERYLLLADDIPGLDVRLALRPMANGQPGDLVGEVAVLRRTAALDFNVQNYGAHELGRIGGTLRGELYDLTGMGDVTTLTAYSSYDFDEQQTLQLAHEFAVGSEGLRLGGQVTLGWTNPSLGIAGFNVKSDTFFTSVHAAYPFLRTQAASVFGSAGVDLVDQDVKANAFLLSRDRVRTAWLRFDTELTDTDSIARRGGFSPFEPKSRAAFGVELRQGIRMLSSNFDCRTNPAPCISSGRLPSRIEQDPTPMLLRADMQAELRPTPTFAVVARASAQYTRDALPAFEEITAGNYSIGRGYDPGAVTGDTGLAAGLELRQGSLAPKSPDALAVQPYVFLDAASLRDRDPSQRLFNPDSLVSAGGGLRFAWGRGIQGDLTVAAPLHRTDGQRIAGDPRGDVRIMFSLTSRLAPWRF